MEGHSQQPPKASLAPAGWYEDPTSDGRQRWWDGSQWTDQFADEAEVSSAESVGVALDASPESFATANGLNVEPDVGPVFEKLRGRVKNALLENLAEGEPVRAVVRGTNGQAIVGTDRRAFVCKPGWMAGATLGAEVTTYNYLNVTGIQLHKGMLTGTVAVETGQQMTKTSYWKQGDKDTYKAPNAIPVGGDWAEVKAGVARLRELVDQAHSPMIARPHAASQTASGSLADELTKLADLREKGVLSPDEFEAAKRRMLST